VLVASLLLRTQYRSSNSSLTLESSKCSSWLRSGVIWHFSLLYQKSTTRLSLSPRCAARSPIFNISDRTSALAAAYWGPLHRLRDEVFARDKAPNIRQSMGDIHCCSVSVCLVSDPDPSIHFHAFLIHSAIVWNCFRSTALSRTCTQPSNGGSCSPRDTCRNVRQLLNCTARLTS
jgi:hypothetical protein